MFLHSTGKHLQYPYVPDPDPTFIIQIMDPHHCCTVFYWYIFFFFADFSADGADHPVLLPHADIHDLQLLAVWSCGVRPHCWVCLFLYRCYVQPFSIGSRKLEYFTNKACLGHLCRKKFHFYFWSFQRYCKTIFSIQNTHVWNVELLITCAVIEANSCEMYEYHSMHTFFSQKKLNYVPPGRNFTFFYDET